MVSGPHPGSILLRIALPPHLCVGCLLRGGGRQWPRASCTESFRQNLAGLGMCVQTLVLSPKLWDMLVEQKRGMLQAKELGLPFPGHCIRESTDLNLNPARPC